MIEYISLKNFKCFDELHIRLTPLTLVTGVNGAGKSTLIQSMLVARQSFISRYLQSGKLSLQDSLVNLIDGVSVMYNQAEEEIIEICVEDSQKAYTFKVNEVDADNHLQSVEVLPDINSIEQLELMADDFVYLNAERLAPQESYRLVNSSEKNYSRLGNAHGDGAIGVLFEAIDKVLELNIKALKADCEDTQRIDENVSAWLGLIMGAQVKAKVDKVNAKELKLTYTIGKVADENNFSPLNAAFGYSYLLPIVVSVLTAKKNGIILLENPEAHLHPGAQFRLGEFLALAAQQGIQIVVETHSDHLLNGVRVATKKRKITPDNITIQYFSEREGIHMSQRIVISEDGDLDKWPEGFFDEWEKALNELIS